MIGEKHIETVKFKTYAEKADTEEKLIHFDDRKDFGDDKFVTTATLFVWKDPKNA